MPAPWGYSIQMDLKLCDAVIIRSKEKIQDYVIQLCKLIDMTRFGDCQIVNFGQGINEGYTLIQLIETSSIVAHFANEINSAFIDLFSCKEFDFNAVMAFTQDFFGAAELASHIAIRGDMYV